MISAAIQETTSESGVSDLDTMTDTAVRCQCCPYGYHIDVDFVRFLQSANPRDSGQMLKAIRKIDKRRTGIRQAIVSSGEDLRSSRAYDDERASQKKLQLSGQDSCYNSSSGLLNPPPTVPSDQSSCASSSRSGSVTLFDSSRAIPSGVNTGKARRTEINQQSGASVYKQVRQTLLELDRIVESYLNDLEKRCKHGRKSRGLRSHSADIKRSGRERKRQLVCDVGDSHESSGDEIISVRRSSLSRRFERTCYESGMDKQARDRRYRSIPTNLQSIGLRPLPPPPEANRLDSPPFYVGRLRPLLITESTRPRPTHHNQQIDNLRAESERLRLELCETLNKKPPVSVREVGVYHQSVPVKPTCSDACVSADERWYEQRIEEIENVYRERIKILEGRLRESQHRPEQRNVSMMCQPDVTSHCLCTDPYPAGRRDVATQFVWRTPTGHACIQSTREPSVVYVPTPKPPQCDMFVQHCLTPSVGFKEVQTTRPKLKSRFVQAVCQTSQAYVHTMPPADLYERDTQTERKYRSVATGGSAIEQRTQATTCPDDCLRKYWHKDVEVDTALLLADSVVNVAIHTDGYNGFYCNSGCQATAPIAHRGCSPCRDFISEFGFKDSSIQAEPSSAEVCLMTDEETIHVLEPEHSSVDLINQSIQTVKLPAASILKKSKQPSAVGAHVGYKIEVCDTSQEERESVHSAPEEILIKTEKSSSSSCEERGSVQEVYSIHEAAVMQTDLDQRDCLDEELYIACAILNEYLYAPNTADENKVRSALSVIQQDWFKAATEPGASIFIVESYLRAFKRFSNFLLERIVNLTDANGNTALHLTICSGNWAVAKLLLESGVCDVDMYNQPGYTALMQAAAIDLISEEQVEIYRLMARSGSVNLRATHTGQTALMIAVQYGKLDTAGLLLEAGAQVNLQDKDGLTSLMYAVQQGKLDMVELILDQPDCDLSIVDHNNNTAMTLASKLGRKDILVALYAKIKRTKGFHTASPKIVGRKPPKNVFWNWRYVLTKNAIDGYRRKAPLES